MNRVGSALSYFREALAAERVTLDREIGRIETDNRDLLAKHQANKALDELVK
jgi:hypothetical protein